ncbi:MAG TPA: SPOR domain-containing protein, partial [Sphingobium sp.]
PPAASSPTTSQLNPISPAQASASASQAQNRLAAPVAAATPANPPVRQQPDPEATRTLADIIHAIDVPDSERQSKVAAVDLSEIEAIQNNRRAERQAAADKAKKTAAAKAKAEADAKAKKLAEEKARLAANPSRNWVQVGTGASRSALEFTLKGLRRKYDDIAPQDGWLASWGRTNRLLIGPFASFTRAKAVESKLKAAGADVFAWKSDAGELVERLGGK